MERVNVFMTMIIMVVMTTMIIRVVFIIGLLCRPEPSQRLGQSFNDSTSELSPV